MNITQTLLSNPSFRQDVKKGTFTANDLLNNHCRDWEKKPSVRRVREVVAVAKELDQQFYSNLREQCDGIQYVKDVVAKEIHAEHEQLMEDRICPEIKTGCFGGSVSYEPYKYDGGFIGNEFKLGIPEPNILSVPVVKMSPLRYGSEIRDGHVIHYVETKPKFSIPESTQPVADDFLKLSGDFAIISDLHVPYHSSKTIEKFLDTAYSKNIRRFIINGDMNDCGQFHPKRAQFQHHSHRYQEDLELDKLIFEEFMKCFPEGGYVLSGNHGGWFVQNMKGELDEDWTYSKFFHEFPLIKFSNFEQCSVTSNNKTIRVAHGANYSGSNPLAVAQKLSAKFDEGICIGHQHLACSGYSWSGKHQVVCLGGSYDLSRLSYVHHSPRTNPSQTNGFALLQEGRLYPYDFQDDMR